MTRGIRAPVLLLLSVLAIGCGESARGDEAFTDAGSAKPSDDAQGSSSDGNPSSGGGHSEAGSSSVRVTRDGSTPTNGANGPEQGGVSGSGAGDGAVRATSGNDAGTRPTGGDDAGWWSGRAADSGPERPSEVGDGGVVTGSGSCCSERDSGGCGNADLMVCVCEKDPSCCTKAWGRQCVFIVEQKYCQAGVRDCVCGSAEGQWDQPQCCTSQWTSTCDSVARLKCDAIPGCF